MEYEISQRLQEQLWIPKPSVSRSILITIGAVAIASAAYFLMPLLYLEIIPTLLTALDDPLSLSSLFNQGVLNVMIPIIQISIAIGCGFFVLRQWLFCLRPHTPLTALKTLFALSLISTWTIFIVVDTLIAVEAINDLFAEDYSNALFLFIIMACLTVSCIFLVKKLVSPSKPFASLALSALFSCLAYCLSVVAILACILAFVGVIMLVLFAFTLLMIAITIPILKCAT